MYGMYFFIFASCEPLISATDSASSKIHIDYLHISHNASGREANIQVLLIRNSSSHTSLDVKGLELPCLAATLCFTRLRNQGSSLMRS